MPRIIPAFLRFSGRVGEVSIAQTRKIASYAGTIAAVAMAATRPYRWPRTVRQEWVRQVVFSGVNAAGITCFLALSLGVLLCVQYQMIVGQFNQSQILPSVFVVAIVRELGPLLVNLVLIARSGNAIATELAVMHATGEIRVIDGQGIDPFSYLVVPRVLGTTFSAICLTVLFIATAMAGVFLCGQWIGAKTGSPNDFTSSVLAILTPADALNLLLKSTIPPLIAGCVCCEEATRFDSSIADVSSAGIRAVQRSIIVLFAASAIISVFTYLR